MCVSDDLSSRMNEVLEVVVNEEVLKPPKGMDKEDEPNPDTVCFGSRDKLVLMLDSPNLKAVDGRINPPPELLISLLRVSFLPPSSLSLVSEF